jgi:hypothetical protein
MTSHTAQVNRIAIGLLSLGCLAGAIVMMPWATDSSSLALLQGGLARGGLLCGALWLALPGRHQEAAWANLSPKTVGGLLLAVLLTMRIPLRILIPAIATVGVLIILLRPRPKKRPAQPFQG